jgi:predicted nucleotide-binding protein
MFDRSEHNLLMGRLGRERAYVLLQKNANVKLLSDLRGPTVVEYEWPNSDRNELSAVGVACNKIRRAIRDLGKYVKLYDAT